MKTNPMINFRFHLKAGIIPVLFLITFIFTLSGCTYTPKQQFASIKKNPSLSCRKLKTRFKSKKEKKKIESNIALKNDNLKWFKDNIREVTLLKNKAHTKTSGRLNKLYCPAILNDDTGGHKLKGTFTIKYSGKNAKFVNDNSFNKQENPGSIKWHTNKKYAKTISKEMRKKKLGKKGYKKYKKLQHHMNCRSHHMKSVMRKNIPHILHLKNGAATISRIKVDDSDHFKGPRKHYVINCIVDVYWSNGERNLGYSFDEWTNQYGQKKVSFTQPGVNGLPF